MSTNKTQNYQLHSWAAGDKFLRSEMNENFTKLDAATRVVVGMYQGDEQGERLIDLGFTPKTVLVITKEGKMSTGNGTVGGIALQGYPLQKNLLEIVEGGFRVRHIQYVLSLNDDCDTFYYWAIR